jgi:hypothetical protein
VGQVEVAHEDDESVLDPLLNALMFWLQKHRQRKHRRPKFRKPMAINRDVVSRIGQCDRTFPKEKGKQIFHPTPFPL